ncbi:MAG: cupin fold metalloprotein, WbuC family [Alphaproteobacteria bacterium]|nr:cupin fold metalloprotein, WbuC family [Alphaproteobacteria bacterium]
MTPLPAGLRAVAPEVLYTRDTDVVRAGMEVVSILRERALASPRKRCRLCAHPDADAVQQEMVIVMHRDSYVQPHRHFGKSETFTVFEGEVDALIFDESGAVIETIPMGPFGTSRQFFYRMPERVFHSMIFRTDWLVYLETTSGPFDKTASEGAPWAPTEHDPAAGRAWLTTRARA